MKSIGSELVAVRAQFIQALIFQKARPLMFLVNRGMFLVNRGTRSRDVTNIATVICTQLLVDDEFARE